MLEELVINVSDFVEMFVKVERKLEGVFFLFNFIKRVK